MVWKPKIAYKRQSRPASPPAIWWIQACIPEVVAKVAQGVISLHGKHKAGNIPSFNNALDLGNGIIKTHRQAGLNAIFAECFKQTVLVARLIGDHCKFLPSILLPLSFSKGSDFLASQIERQNLRDPPKSFF